MKNVDKNYSIIEKIETNNKVIADNSCYYILKNFLNLNKEIDSGEVRHWYYESAYLDEVKKIEKEYKKDPVFDALFYSDKITIMGNEYALTEIYIYECEGEIYLVSSNNNKIDLLTGNQIIKKRNRISRFRESTIFYNLYKQGLLSEPLNIDSNLIDIIKTWDGEKSDAYPYLMANKKANEVYRKKYDIDESMVDYYNISDGINTIKIYPILKTIINNKEYLVFVNNFKDDYKEEDLFISTVDNNTISSVTENVLDIINKELEKNM